MNDEQRKQFREKAKAVYFRYGTSELTSKKEIEEKQKELESFIDHLLEGERERIKVKIIKITDTGFDCICSEKVKKYFSDLSK